MKEEGKRYNEGKLRIDLITPEITEGIADVMSWGASKYSDRNWEQGMKWSKVIASLKRHLLAFEKGEDFDKESGLLHLDHLLCNAGFLSTYYKHHPEYDDRPNTFFDKKIALDIDGVICDWNKGISDLNGTEYERNHWYYSYSVKRRQLDGLSNNKEFWMNLEPIFNGPDIPFDPVCYVTSRPIKKEWCEEWIEKNNFPCVPVHVTNGDKSKILKPMVDQGEVDFFVDDKYQNFVELNKNGVFTYLMDQPWNWKYEVGHRRIYSLKDLV